VGDRDGATGWQRLIATQFAADYWPFLTRDKLAGAMLCKVAESLRDLDDPDLLPFAVALFGPDAAALVNAAHTLRERRDEKMEDVLPTVLDRLWSDGLQNVVQRQLQQAYWDNAPIYPKVAANAGTDEKPTHAHASGKAGNRVSRRQKMGIVGPNPLAVRQSRLRSLRQHGLARRAAPRRGA